MLRWNILVAYIKFFSARFLKVQRLGQKLSLLTWTSRPEENFMTVQDALDYETLGFITNFETFSMVALRGQKSLQLMEKTANIRFLRNRAKHNGCSKNPAKEKHEHLRK